MRLDSGPGTTAPQYGREAPSLKRFLLLRACRRPSLDSGWISQHEVREDWASHAIELRNQLLVVLEKLQPLVPASPNQMNPGLLEASARLSWGGSSWRSPLVPSSGRE